MTTRIMQRALLLLSAGAVAMSQMDGTYYVFNKFSGKVMDVEGASKDNSANIQVSDAVESASQQWTFTAIGDGYYKIINGHSGLAVDVAGVSAEDGANIQQYKYAEQHNQEFAVRAADDGYVSIHSRHTEKVLEIYAWQMDSGASVKQWEFLDGANQLWRLIPVPASAPNGGVVASPDAVIADGEYLVGNKFTGKYLDVGGSTDREANVQVADGTFTRAQMWKFTNLNNGYYKIENVNSGLGLDVAEGGKDDGDNIIQYPYSGAENQEFAVKQEADGYVSILTRHADKAVEVSEWDTDVKQWTFTGMANQLWMVFKGPPAAVPVSVGPSMAGQVESGLYKIGNKWNGLYLDVEDQSLDKQKDVEVNSEAATMSQVWYIESLDDGYFSIMNGLSGLGLDIKGASDVDGANVQQYPYKNQKNQQFEIRGAADGYVSFHPKVSGKAVEVYEWETTDGSTVKQYEFTGGANQLWMLIPTSAIAQ